MSRRVFIENHSYENVFPLQALFIQKQTYFHLKGFARGLALKQRHKVTLPCVFKETPGRVSGNSTGEGGPQNMNYLKESMNQNCNFQRDGCVGGVSNQDSPWEGYHMGYFLETTQPSLKKD